MLLARLERLEKIALAENKSKDLVSKLTLFFQSKVN